VVVRLFSNAALNALHLVPTSASAHTHVTICTDGQLAGRNVMRYVVRMLVMHRSGFDGFGAYLQMVRK